MAENVEKIITEDEETVEVVERRGFFRKVGDKIAAVPKQAKIAAAGIAGAVAVGAIGWRLLAQREANAYMQENGLTIDDIKADPELKGHFEAEFGPLEEEA